MPAATPNRSPRGGLNPVFHKNFPGNYLFLGNHMVTIRNPFVSTARPLRDTFGPRRPHKEHLDASEDVIFQGIFMIPV